MKYKIFAVGLSICILAGILTTWAGITMAEHEKRVEMDRLLGFSSEHPWGEIDEAIENPPINKDAAREIADRFISFPSEPEVKLKRDRHGCLSWKISVMPLTRIEIDARTGDVLHISDDRGLSFAQGLKGSEEDVARQVMEKLGWPKPDMNLVYPWKQSIGTAAAIYWHIEFMGIPCDGLTSVMFNEEGQPTQAGHTWLIIEESGTVTPEILENEATSIGKETAIKYGWAHDDSSSKSELIWRRPGDIDNFGYKCKLTWATTHSNPSPGSRGTPSEAYVYVDALTGDVIGIDCTRG